MFSFCFYTFCNYVQAHRRNLKISKERGIWKEILIKNKTFLTMITFHPAYLLRQADQKKYSWLDLKEIRKKIDELKIDI